MENINQEKNNAAEAIESAKAILGNKDDNLVKICMTRKETATYLGITTIDFGIFNRKCLFRFPFARLVGPIYRSFCIGYDFNVQYRNTCRRSVTKYKNCKYNSEYFVFSYANILGSNTSL